MPRSRSGRLRRKVFLLCVLDVSRLGSKWGVSIRYSNLRLFLLWPKPNGSTKSGHTWPVPFLGFLKIFNESFVFPCSVDSTGPLCVYTQRVSISLSGGWRNFTTLVTSEVSSPVNLTQKWVSVYSRAPPDPYMSTGALVSRSRPDCPRPLSRPTLPRALCTLTRPCGGTYLTTLKQLDPTPIYPETEGSVMYSSTPKWFVVSCTNDGSPASVTSKGTKSCMLLPLNTPNSRSLTRCPVVTLDYDLLWIRLAPSILVHYNDDLTPSPLLYCRKAA